MNTTHLKTLKAIAINTIGAGLILVGAQLPDEVAAIATISLGFGACGVALGTAIALQFKQPFLSIPVPCSC